MKQDELLAEQPPVVYIVDDDASMRDALLTLLMPTELEPVLCHSAADFLERFDRKRTGCLVLDVRMPEVNGLELLSTFQDAGINIPTIVISGHGDIRTAVQAMKFGAVDFLEKPFRGSTLLGRITNCIYRDMARRNQSAEQETFANRLSRLSRRENEVLDCIARGYSNKEAAKTLGISFRTVEAHRNRIMFKLKVSSLAELVRLHALARSRIEEQGPG